MKELLLMGIFLFSILIGYLLVERIRTRTKTLSQLEQIFIHMETDLITTAKPLHRLLQVPFKDPISQLFCQIGDYLAHHPNKKPMDGYEAVLAVQKGIEFKEVESKYLQLFFMQVGKGYLEEEIALLKMIRQKMKEEKEISYESYKKNKKPILSGSVLIGLLLVILMV